LIRGWFLIIYHSLLLVCGSVHVPLFGSDVAAQYYLFAEGHVLEHLCLVLDARLDLEDAFVARDVLEDEGEDFAVDALRQFGRVG
jgi:hypothetical protein